MEIDDSKSDSKYSQRWFDTNGILYLNLNVKSSHHKTSNWIYYVANMISNTSQQRALEAIQDRRWAGWNSWKTTKKNNGKLTNKGKDYTLCYSVGWDRCLLKLDTVPCWDRNLRANAMWLFSPGFPGEFESITPFDYALSCFHRAQLHIAHLKMLCSIFNTAVETLPPYLKLTSSLKMNNLN